MLVFAPLWLSLHWEILIILLPQLPSSSEWNASFHCIAYDYSRADWKGLCDDLRDVLWEDSFKFRAFATATEFCGWLQVGVGVYIPHRNYQIKPRSSPWFSATFAASIVLLEASKLAYANKTKRIHHS